MREVRNTGKKKKRKNGLKIIAVAVLVLFGVITYSSVELHAEKRALEQRLDEREERFREEMERTEELEKERARRQTVHYIIEYARNFFGLVFPDEVILIPEDEE